jgi:hypothetical protein
MLLRLSTAFRKLTTPFQMSFAKDSIRAVLANPYDEKKGADNILQVAAILKKLPEAARAEAFQFLFDNCQTLIKHDAIDFRESADILIAGVATLPRQDAEAIANNVLEYFIETANFAEFLHPGAFPKIFPFMPESKRIEAVEDFVYTVRDMHERGIFSTAIAGITQIEAIDSLPHETRKSNALAIRTWLQEEFKKDTLDLYSFRHLMNKNDLYLGLKNDPVPDCPAPDKLS